MELRVLLLLPLCFPGLQARTPDAKERQSEGSTLSVQCPYTAEANYYQQKAWCRVKDDKCDKVLVETTYPTQYPYTTQATKGRVTIEDNLRYRTVSITVTNLQVEDSGTYSCASRSYNYGYIPLRMISLDVFKGLQARTPDAKERHSEGSTLSVQCPYTAEANSYQQKAWCRVRGGKCDEVLVETTFPTQYPYTTQATKGRVTIEDNPRYRTVSIAVTNLQVEDSGTYSCASRSYYYGYIPLRTISLDVFKVLAETTSSYTAGTSQTTLSGNTPAPSSNVNTFSLLFGVLSILLILALTGSITLSIWRRKQLKRRGTRQAEDTYDKPEDIAQLNSTERMESPRDDSKDIQYVTLNFKSRLSPEDTLYCNLEPSQTHMKPNDENVEYAIIALKQLPTNDKG